MSQVLSIVKAPYASWFELDAQAGTATKISKDDPRVIKAIELGVDYLPGTDFVIDTTSLRERIAELEAEVGALHGRLTMAQGEALTLRAANVLLNGTASSAGVDELSALQQELAALKEQFFDASYENAEHEHALRELLLLHEQRAEDAAYACAVDELALREGVMQVVARNTQLQDDIVEVRQENADLSTENAVLSTAKTNLEAEVARLNAEVTRLNARPAPAPAAPAATPSPFASRSYYGRIRGWWWGWQAAVAAIVLALLCFEVYGVKTFFTRDSAPTTQVATQAAPAPASTVTPAPTQTPVQLATNCDAVTDELRSTKRLLGIATARAERVEQKQKDSDKEYAALEARLSEATAALAAANAKAGESVVTKSDPAKEQGKVPPAPLSQVVPAPTSQVTQAPLSDDSRCSSPGMKFSRVANRCLFVR